MPFYRSKQEPVEAVQLIHRNGERLAQWCGGEWRSLAGRGDKGEDLSHIDMAEDGGRIPVGNWVIRYAAGGFTHLPPEVFEEQYEQVSNVPTDRSEQYKKAAGIMYEALKQISSGSAWQPDGHSMRKIAMKAIQDLAEAQFK